MPYTRRLPRPLAESLNLFRLYSGEPLLRIEHGGLRQNDAVDQETYHALLSGGYTRQITWRSDRQVFRNRELEVSIPTSAVFIAALNGHVTTVKQLYRWFCEGNFRVRGIGMMRNSMVDVFPACMESGRMSDLSHYCRRYGLTTPSGLIYSAIINYAVDALGFISLHCRAEILFDAMSGMGSLPMPASEWMRQNLTRETQEYICYRAAQYDKYNLLEALLKSGFSFDKADCLAVAAPRSRILISGTRPAGQI